MGSLILFGAILNPPQFGAGIESDTLGFASPAVVGAGSADGLYPILPFPTNECNAFRLPLGVPSSGFANLAAGSGAVSTSSEAMSNHFSNLTLP